MRKDEIRSPEPEVRKPRGTGKTKEGPISKISNQIDVGRRTLIIGYGNPLRSDDALGWHASRLLAETLKGQNVEVITCHQLTPELAEPLSQCSRVAFIDADAEGKPGAIHRRPVRPQALTSSSFTHTCTPSGLLSSAKQLYGRRPHAIVITVTAQSFEFGHTLSPVVSATLPKVVEQVCNWLGVPQNKDAHKTGAYPAAK
jgi:hydrogenase maturation protease